MREEQAIEFSNKIDSLEKLRYYMAYAIEHIVGKYSNPDVVVMQVTFDRFCSDRNIIRHDAGENWNKGKKLKGVHGYEFDTSFACQKWINLTAPSVFHSVYHNLSLIKNSSQ